MLRGKLVAWMCGWLVAGCRAGGDAGQCGTQEAGCRHRAGLRSDDESARPCGFHCLPRRRYGLFQRSHAAARQTGSGRFLEKVVHRVAGAVFLGAAGSGSAPESARWPCPPGRSTTRPGSWSRVSARSGSGSPRASGRSCSTMAGMSATAKRPRRRRNRQWRNALRFSALRGRRVPCPTAQCRKVFLPYAVRRHPVPNGQCRKCFLPSRLTASRGRKTSDPPFSRLDMAPIVPGLYAGSACSTSSCTRVTPLYSLASSRNATRARSPTEAVWPNQIAS